jgi:hypothetical protein
VTLLFWRTIRGAEDFVQAALSRAAVESAGVWTAAGSEPRARAEASEGGVAWGLQGTAAAAGHPLVSR